MNPLSKNQRLGALLLFGLLLLAAWYQWIQ